MIIAEDSRSICGCAYVAFCVVHSVRYRWILRREACVTDLLGEVFFFFLFRGRIWQMPNGKKKKNKRVNERTSERAHL